MYRRFHTIIIMPTVPDIHRRGLRSAQPAANTVTIGTLYFVTDENLTERSNGTSWETYSGISGGGPPSLHASTHSSGGTDPVTLTNLAGFPGGTSTFLRADGTFAAPTPAVRRQVTMIIDGGTSVITTGVKGFISLPIAGTWKKWRLLSADAA